MRRTHIIGTAAALLIVAGAAVAATSNPSSNPVANTAAKTAAETSPAFARDSDASGGAVAADSPSGAPTSASRSVEAAPRVVKTATIELSVSDKRVTKVADATSSLASSLGGFVASTQRSSGDGTSATLTIRVPAASFDNALRELRKLGKVSNEELGGQDVTGQLVDLDARIRSLRAQEQALNALLAKANTVGETLQVAQAAGDVRTQIEQLAAQQQTLADQADFATITAHIAGPGGVVPTEPSPDPLLVKSFRTATNATLSVIGGVLVVLGFLLPLAAMGGLGFGVWRLLRRRHSGVPLALDGTV